MSVYKAICAVQSDLVKTGISKDSTNTFDNYKFRGIDAVYNALSPLLAKHGLCILPRMISRTCEERVGQKGTALFYVTVDAEFDFVCAEDGSKHTVKTYGEAMDRGDKATNKAMSAAYKYAAFQTFAIPTEGDNDADGHTHVVEAKKPVPESAKSASQDAWDKMDAAQQAALEDISLNVIAIMTEDIEIGPFQAVAYIDQAQLSADEKAALWSQFDSKQRSAMKKAAEAIRLDRAMQP